MVALKYLLMIAGVVLFGSAMALMAYDVYLAAQLRRMLRQQLRRRSSAGVARIAPRALTEGEESANAGPRRAA